jgi:nucleotidyltransferase substrate binding protein (TIGR01987 family)
MEQTRRYQLKLTQLIKAVSGFKSLLEVDTTGFNETLKDGIKNGQIQKFEYSTELLWKTIREYLLAFHGIETVSPKSAISGFLSTKNIDEPAYEILINMIKDRNTLSHIYKEEDYSIIYTRLPEYLNSMIKVTDILASKKSSLS